MFFFVECAKGGSGGTVTSVCLAGSLARRTSSDVVLVDLAGDIPVACGRPLPRWGVTDWLATPDGEAAALRRLEIDVAPFSMLSVGAGDSWSPERVDDLLTALRSNDRHVVVDAGLLGDRALGDRALATPLDGLKRRLLAEADRSVLVTRACYLGLKRAEAIGERIDVVVLVREVGRTLDGADIGRTLSVDRVVEVDYDPAMARMVDAGTLVDRGSRVMDRALRKVA